MKTLTSMQKQIIENSMLRNGRSEKEIKDAIAAKEAKMNEPKKETFWNTFDESNENGIM